MSSRSTQLTPLLLSVHIRPLRYRPHVKAVLRNSTRHYSAPISGSIPASKQRFVPQDGTYPQGFLVSGVHVGVKASNTRRPDLALIVSKSPCAAAAVFTQNKFQAAPVLVSRKTLEATQGKDVRAIVVNSGCANAVTGKGGLDDAAAMKKAVEDCIASEVDEGKSGQTLVMSTGVIGQRYRHGLFCPLDIKWSWRIGSNI